MVGREDKSNGGRGHGVGVASVEGGVGCRVGPRVWAWPGLGPHQGLKWDWIFQGTEEPATAQEYFASMATEGMAFRQDQGCGRGHA